MPPFHYELTIRNRDDTADLVIISTVPTDAHPFILTPPEGDGESFDPLSGETNVGVFRLQIVDALHAVSSRVLTRELADAAKRWNLNGNKARLRVSEALPPVWSSLLTGYLIEHKLIDALGFDLAVGETRYLEQRYQIFKTVSTNFDRASNLIGSPVRGGFAEIADGGPWRFTVTAVAATHVTGRLTAVNLPIAIPGASVLDGILAKQINRQAREYFVADGTWRTSVGGYGWYPRMNARIETTASPPVLVGHFNPIEAPGIYGVGLGGGLIDRSNLTIRLDWTGPSHDPPQPAQPLVGDVFGIYVFPTDISNKNPLHVRGHPIDIHILAYDEAGIPYDVASANAAKAALGSDLFVELRPTRGTTIAELARTLQGLFGYATRIGPNGERVFLTTRLRGAAPALTVTKSDIRDEGMPFALDVKSAVSSIAVRQQTFVRFDPEIDTGEPALDKLVAVNQRAIGSVPDAIPVGQREVAFEIDGRIMQRTVSLLPPIGETVLVPVDLARFARGIASEIGDRYGRGAWKASHRLRRGIDVNIGDELVLDLDYQPNPETTPASRGGQRVVQVVQRTPTPEGTDIEVVDSGNAAQVPTAPTFTLAAAAEDPKRTVIATITNAAALIADGSLVRIEWSTGGANRTLFTVHDPNDGSTVRFPPVDSGTAVTVGMRAEQPTRRPSAYATATLDLADLAAPTLLSVTGRVASWTIGEADALVEVLVKRSADGLYQRAALLGAGSTSYTFDSLDGGVSHDIQVRHRDAPPLNGVSTVVSATFTPAGSAAPAAPTAPSIWSGTPDGSGVTVLDGTWGYDVSAVLVPGIVEFEVAVETAVGSGTPGAYTVAERITAVSGDRVRYLGYAPADGKRRYARAFTVTADGVRSASSSTALSILPWGTVTRARTGPRDLIQFATATGADDGYAAKAQDTAGLELPAATRQDDGVQLRIIAKGHLRAENVRNGISVSFPVNFQSPPMFVPRGGALSEPRSKWGATGDGTESGAFNGALPVYDDTTVVNLTASGGTLRARLRQKGGSTLRTHTFPASNDLDTVGETAEVTLSNAPAVDDLYTARYSVSLQVTGGSRMSHGEDIGYRTVTIVVALETSANAGVDWTERQTKSYTYTEYAGATSTQQWLNESMSAVVTGLDSTDKVRLKLKSITIQHDGGGTQQIDVHGFDGTGDAVAYGVNYNTASDVFASRTPDTDDGLTIDFIEVSE